MPTLSVMCGIVLSALGLVAYLAPEALGVGKDGGPPKPMSPTSLTPVVLGGLLFLAGLVSILKDGMRKHMMHMAAAVSLLGSVGGLVPVILRNFHFPEVAVKVGLTMCLVSAFFLALAVNSFIQARKARAAASTPPVA
ncbi:MAG: hypothetical protein LC104_01930 [Bacteroidales bacterium]|nr:hypothetical protein [Bacteroidales bacterium]